MYERRQYKRILVDRRVGIVQPNGAVLYGMGCDISKGGLAVKTDIKIEVGTVLQIFFNLSFQDEVKRFVARCKIVYVGFVGDEDKFRLGMQFIEMGQEEQNMLNAFLAYRMGRT